MQFVNILSFNKEVAGFVTEGGCNNALFACAVSCAHEAPGTDALFDDVRQWVNDHCENFETVTDSEIQKPGLSGVTDAQARLPVRGIVVLEFRMLRLICVRQSLATRQAALLCYIIFAKKSWSFRPAFCHFGTGACPGRLFWVQ